MSDRLRFFRDAYQAGLGKQDAERVKLMNGALADYCYANYILPIRRSDYESGRWTDPTAIPMRPPWLVSGIMFEEMDDGKSVEEAFETAFNREVADCLWRVMRDDEKPKPGELLARMGDKDRAVAMEMFGAGNVVKQILADGALSLVRNA